MSLVAMETPVSMSANDIRDEKVKVLRCTAPLKAEDVVTVRGACMRGAGGRGEPTAPLPAPPRPPLQGQYGPNAAGTKAGCLSNPGVPADSLCPTFATAVLHVNNPRWAGVPFILKCGKALDERKAEIRIQFREPELALPGPRRGAQQRARPAHPAQRGRVPQDDVRAAARRAGLRPPSIEAPPRAAAAGARCPAWSSTPRRRS